MADLVNMRLNNVKELQGAIKVVHGCESRHVASVPVKTLESETAWEGWVEVFRIVGHPKAVVCYAWQYEDGSEMKSIAVLEIPPVDSPQSAVRVAIAATGKP